MKINYIVSGLPRSGTSMVMQILNAGEASLAYDGSRKSDYHNPKGYYELEGGKIISRLEDGSFPLEKYYGKFIKITAYGLKLLPEGNYKIIYMTRNIDEVMNSMEKMSGEVDREKEKPLFEKLNDFSIEYMEKREDIKYIVVNYRDVIDNPRGEIERINNFLGGMLDVDSAKRAVDKNLYRNVRK